MLVAKPRDVYYALWPMRGDGERARFSLTEIGYGQDDTRIDNFLFCITVTLVVD